MARTRKCRDCKKKLTDKYYIISGVGGYEASRANFCSLCCDKRKKNSNLKRLIEEGETKVVEKEVGDKFMDSISEFEDKWENHNNLGVLNITPPDNKTLLNSIRQACQELKPYLQKPEIVEKAWGREYDSEEYGVDVEMIFYYLFTKSTREKNYKQEVVQPTVQEILGGKLDEEINITTTNNSPGVPGRADGHFKINGKLVGNYNWVDHTNECRRLSFNFLKDNNFVLQAFLRALKIKEKELQGNNSPIQPEERRKNNNMEPDRKIIKQYFLRNNISFAQLSGNDNSLMTLYYKKKSPEHKDKPEWTTEEKHIESYLKKQNKKFLTRKEIDNWIDIEKISNQPKTSSNPINWNLIIGLFIVGVILLGGLIIFLRAKKKKAKN